jgi:hypothetical protein
MTKSATFKSGNTRYSAKGRAEPRPTGRSFAAFRMACATTSSSWGLMSRHCRRASNDSRGNYETGFFPPPLKTRFIEA